MLKFGGTSVSSAANWHNIAGVLRARMDADLRPVIVHSALSGITDRLESLLAAAVAGTHTAALERIETMHRELAQAFEHRAGDRVRATSSRSCEAHGATGRAAVAR